MKKVIFFAVTLFAANSFAQLINSVPPTGLVGIGTTTPSPSHQLTVNGNSLMNNNLDVNEDIQVSGQTIMNGIVRMHGLVPYDSGYGDMELIVCGPTGFISRTSIAELSGILNTPPASELAYCSSGLAPQWFAGEAKLFTPCPDVNVGIGTSTPNHRLTVIGNAFSNTFLAGNSGGTTNAIFNGFAQGTTQELLVLGRKDGSGTQSTLFTVNNNGATEISNNNTAPTLTLNSGTGHALLINDNSGNKILQLEGDGLLRGRKMRLDEYTWADYVFQEDYKLQPLESTKAFIEENGHLPNVPSAKQVVENGVDVADMLRIQMEKIEELTLHLIEMNERLEKVENENLLLKKENQQLSK